MQEKELNLPPLDVEKLKQALKRSYKERFEMATLLYKVQQTMKKATITHKPFISK